MQSAGKKLRIISNALELGDKHVICRKLLSMKETIIKTEQQFSCEPSRLWKAITHAEEMRQWFFDNIPDFKAEVGFETKFMVDAGERQFMHLWKIIEVIPEKLIKYEWCYEGYKGTGYVTFRIDKNDHKTFLTLTNEGLESFHPKVPEFTRENCTMGWRYFINDRLKDYIAKL